MDYFKAPAEILEVVKNLVKEHHERLDGARIAILCKEKASKSGNRIVFAKASLPPAKLKPLLDQKYHFVICIGYDEWEKRSDQQQTALLDHELCHCSFDPETGEPAMRPHDLEEFGEVIDRHGFWRLDAGERAVQLSLGLNIDRAPAVVQTPPCLGERPEES